MRHHKIYGDDDRLHVSILEKCEGCRRRRWRVYWYEASQMPMCKRCLRRRGWWSATVAALRDQQVRPPSSQTVPEREQPSRPRSAPRLTSDSR